MLPQQQVVYARRVKKCTWYGINNSIEITIKKTYELIIWTTFVQKPNPGFFRTTPIQVGQGLGVGVRLSARNKFYGILSKILSRNTGTTRTTYISYFSILHPICFL